MGVIGTLLVLTGLASVAGLALGGLLGALFNVNSERTVGLLLSLAGGVMLGVLWLDLIPEALETDVSVFFVMAALLLGALAVYALNALLDHNGASHAHAPAAGNLAKTPQTTDIKAKSRVALLRSGVVMASAIALHNLPEGMSIGALYAGEGGVMGGAALLMAVMIGLHNVPAGMAIAVTMESGGMAKARAVLLTALSGVPTLIGALCGFWLGDIGELGLALSLSFAGGAMLYVVSAELIPEAEALYRSKLPVFGVIIGVIITMGLLSFFSIGH